MTISSLDVNIHPRVKTRQLLFVSCRNKAQRCSVFSICCVRGTFPLWPHLQTRGIIGANYLKFIGQTLFRLEI